MCGAAELAGRHDDRARVAEVGVARLARASSCRRCQVSRLTAVSDVVGAVAARLDHDHAERGGQPDHLETWLDLDRRTAE